MPLIESNKPYFQPLNGSAHQVVTLGTGIYTYNVPLQANNVAVQAVTQNVRFTLDGSAPSATTGFQLVAGDPAILITLTPTTTLRFFREASGAILQIQAGV